MKEKYHIVNEEGLLPFIPELRSIEKKIEYPLEDGATNFFIDHGEKYSPFFTQQGYKTRFLIITQKDEVIGNIAGVWKKIYLGKRTYNALYASDLKLKPEYRGRGVVKKFLWHLFIRWPFVKEFQGWDFVYFCAMQRESLGVDATFKGAHLGRLTKPKSILNVYILDPKQLFGYDLKNICHDPDSEMNLSQHLKDEILWNDGKKNIISTKDSSLLKLGHLNPELLYIHNTEKLKKAIYNINKRKNGRLCFAIDCRNAFQINWLKEQGIYTETKCKVFSFAPFSNPFGFIKSVSISTGEI